MAPYSAGNDCHEKIDHRFWQERINRNVGICCYYGHYRTKLSRKYNILHNSRYDMFVHALPCVHQLSLCQEYNTVSRLEIEPVYAVNFY